MHSVIICIDDVFSWTRGCIDYLLTIFSHLFGIPFSITTMLLSSIELCQWNCLVFYLVLLIFTIIMKLFFLFPRRKILSSHKNKKITMMRSSKSFDVSSLIQLTIVANLSQGQSCIFGESLRRQAVCEQSNFFSK